MTKSTSSALFQDDDSSAPSPWDMPTPRKRLPPAPISFATLLPASDVPDGYVEAYDAIIREHGSGGRISPGGIAGRWRPHDLEPTTRHGSTAFSHPRARAPGGAWGGDEFNVLLALIGLAQEGKPSAWTALTSIAKVKFKPGSRASLSYLRSPSQFCTTHWAVHVRSLCSSVARLIRSRPRTRNFLVVAAIGALQHELQVGPRHWTAGEANALEKHPDLPRPKLPGLVKDAATLVGRRRIGSETTAASRHAAEAYDSIHAETGSYAKESIDGLR